MTAFDPISDALNAIRQGRMVVVVDDEHRENEGDLVMAAVHVTADDINFMSKEGRGLICAPIDGSITDRLELEPMVRDNTERVSTNFTVSVDYRHGTSTGISAYDRAMTVRALVDEQAKSDDFLRPGHMFPLKADEGGVLSRAGHTEAAVDLAKLAGLPPAGVVCEIMNQDGSMARLPELREFAKKFNLPIISIGDLIAYRTNSGT